MWGSDTLGAVLKHLWTTSSGGALEGQQEETGQHVALPRWRHAGTTRRPPAEGGLSPGWQEGVATRTASLESSVVWH